MGGSGGLAGDTAGHTARPARHVLPRDRCAGVVLQLYSGCGSTLTGCTALVDGAGSPFASGTALPTALGSHTLVVTATEVDTATNTVTATATGDYVVAGAPTAQMSSPGGGQTYALGQSVPTTFSCADGPGGLGISTCVDSNRVSGGTGLLDTAATAHTPTRSRRPATTG